MSLFDRIKLDMKTILYLFDVVINHILLYGSEVCGVYSLKEIDKLQKIYKKSMGVRKQTSNAAVYKDKEKNDFADYMDQCNNITGKSWAQQLHSILNDIVSFISC